MSPDTASRLRKTCFSLRDIMVDTDKWKGKNAMELEGFFDIYRNIESTSLTDLRDDLINSAVRYARLRVDWKLADVEERKALDQRRRIAHDTFIDACNILARNMSIKNESDVWRDNLGDERKVIGDFACFIHFILGLSAA